MANYKIEIEALYGGTYSDYNGEPLNDELARRLADELCDSVWRMLHCDADVTVKRCEMEDK